MSSTRQPPQASTESSPPVYQSEDYGPVALATKLKWYTSEAAHNPKHGFAYSEGFVQAYRDIATHGAPAYTKIFRHILERNDQPFVFHCTAGKDRTGVFGALIMKLVGVDEETICWEYALTEPGLGEWRRQFIDRIASGGIGSGGGRSNPKPDDPAAEAKKDHRAISREEAARICGSRAGNMRAWMREVLDGELGGVERYLGERCGFSAQEIERLRGVLVQEVDAAQVVKPVGIEGWTPDGGVVDS